MTVYVDRPAYPFPGKRGTMIMCHMVADTREELDQMVDQLGLKRGWIQKEGTYQEHYDLSMTKRAEAVKFGAVEVTYRELGEILKARREKT